MGSVDLFVLKDRNGDVVEDLFVLDHERGAELGARLHEPGLGGREVAPQDFDLTDAPVREGAHGISRCTAGKRSDGFIVIFLSHVSYSQIKLRL